MAERGVQLRERLGLITQEEFADMLDITVETIREWRRLGQGPDFVKTGKGVMYRDTDILEWLKLNVVPVVRRMA